MSLWQKTMIGLALNQQVRSLMQRNSFAARLATQFVGGPDANMAKETAVNLNKRGFRASLYYLGEYVDSLELIAENIKQIIAAVRILGQAELDVHISVDPTQAGYSLGDEVGEQNILEIGRVLAEQPGQGKKLLMLDMEDFSCVQKTLELYYRLVRENIPAAITIQAYLYRSEKDIRQLIENGATVRLVKGAFAERKERAWTSKSEINRNYLHLAQLLLSPEARSRGVYPVFGTHDINMIEAIRRMTRESAWDVHSFEFEMLYGVRAILQQQLVEEGYHVRLYLPFGTEWWPYTIRRVGENPAILKFILQAIRSRPDKTVAVIK